jgi:hypothetical protein
MFPMPKDDNGVPLPIPRWGTSQDVAFTDAHAESVAFAAETRVLRLAATADCRVAIGLAPVATAASTLLHAGATEFVPIEGGELVSVLQEAAAGKLNITEIQ